MNITWKSVVTTGISIGFGFVLGLTAAHWHRPPPQGMQMHGARHAGHFVKRMARKLDLSEEQQTKVHEIFNKRHERMKALHDEMFPKIEGIRKEIEAEIRPLLSAEQNERFDEMRKKMEKRRKEFRGFFKGRKGHGRRHHHGFRPSEDESGAEHRPPPPPPPQESREEIE